MSQWLHSVASAANNLLDAVDSRIATDELELAHNPTHSVQTLDRAAREGSAATAGPGTPSSVVPSTGLPAGVARSTCLDRDDFRLEGASVGSSVPLVTRLQQQVARLQTELQDEKHQAVRVETTLLTRQHALEAQARQLKDEVLRAKAELTQSAQAHDVLSVELASLQASRVHLENNLREQQLHVDNAPSAVIAHDLEAMAVEHENQHEQTLRTQEALLVDVSRRLKDSQRRVRELERLQTDIVHSKVVGPAIDQGLGDSGDQNTDPSNLSDDGSSSGASARPVASAILDSRAFLESARTPDLLEELTESRRRLSAAEASEASATTECNTLRSELHRLEQDALSAAEATTRWQAVHAQLDQSVAVREQQLKEALAARDAAVRRAHVAEARLSHDENRHHASSNESNLHHKSNLSLATALLGPGGARRHKVRAFLFVVFARHLFVMRVD
eukprot:INCI7700.10.p1 GENE.INCI7700.10~~INCI7700.10.p1  ORF type:complete len:448 (+),score=101.96 INCI7700.10:94-1437(+)